MPPKEWGTPKHRAILESLELNSVYLSKINSIRIKFLLAYYRGTAEEWALIDSGATENFIDTRTVAKLRLGTKKLTIRRPVYNIDGTPNLNGEITHAVDLLVKQGNKKETLQFYITNLGKDAFVLGYPWFRIFNPAIDWTNGNINGPQIKMETIQHKVYEKAQQWLKRNQDDDLAIATTMEANPENILEELEEITQASDGEEIWINTGCIQTAIEMAHKYAEKHGKEEVKLPNKFK